MRDTDPNARKARFARLTAWLAAALLVTAGCRERVESRARDRGVGTAAADAMLEADFRKLDNLPNNFPLELSPPTVVLDSRFSSDGQDVRAKVGQAQAGANAAWNTLEIVSGNANLRGIGVRPGDIVKVYMFPDSETRNRQNITGEIDMQMASHEPTELVVAQVLDDHRLQVEDGITPPRDLSVVVSEDDYAQAFGLSIEQLDRLRAQGRVDSFGVHLDAAAVPLDRLASLAPTVAWPPRVEIWREKDDRMRAINRALASYVRSGEPPLGWEPTPDALELERLVESFNRWLRSRKDTTTIEPPELLSTLPADLRDNARLQPFIAAEALNRDTFDAAEGRQFQQAVWCRDIGFWAAGTSFDPLPRAERLFDWVVRNITLTDSPRVTNHRPWESLLYGRGTAAQRAWVFCSLCRQQRIPHCVVTLPPSDEGGDPWLWCGVVDHERLYLFDPQLGLPVPGPEGGVATLGELIQDPGLLRALDLPDDPYPVAAEALTRAEVAVVAEPLTLSARAGHLQDKQSGRTAMVLRLEVDKAAEQLRAVEGVRRVALWAHPFENLLRELRLADADSAAAETTRSAAAVDIQPFAWTPELWKARTLHFRGLLEGENAARDAGELIDPVNDHRAAAQLYLDPRVRPADTRLAELAPGNERRRVLERNKADATYWLAMLKFEERLHEQALEWLERLDTTRPEAEHLADGVRYLAARSLEALGRRDEAIELYQQDDSPQRHGDWLRAERLAADDAPPRPAAQTADP